ncbi:MAG: YggT family protein [Gammaproteobacteria bacterium]
MGSLGSAGYLIVSSLGGLYILAVLLRFMLQVARADFYNPFTQAIVKVTDPTVRLFRRFIPGFRGFDFASLLLALVAQCIATTLLIYFSGYALPGIGLIVSWSSVGLLSFILNILFWSMIISIVSSFIAPFSRHPGLVLVRQLTEPVMEPLRRLLPSMGGLDFSPIFLFLALQIIRVIFIDPVGVNTRLVLGI